MTLAQKYGWKNHYDRRDHNVRAIGFKSYREYLQSDLWKQIKIEAFRKHGNKCRRCGGKAQTFHHRKYTQPVLLGKNLGYLTPICHACHKHIEFDDNGRKLKISGANARLK